MKNRKIELYEMLADLQRQAVEMAAAMPSQVAEKLTFNARLKPTRLDFDADFEFYRCRLDVTDNSQYPLAATLIQDMRQTRQEIHNLLLIEAQCGPDNTMTC